MSRSFSCEAVVLKAYDVGEADRFCILLTRERGRLTARASGARRPRSRLGGFLLPFQHLSLTLKEGTGSMHVAGAAPAEPRLQDLSLLAPFTQAQQGIELLLSLVSHEEPIPQVFAATLSFLVSCRLASENAALAYTARLLRLLGLLPSVRELGELITLSEAERMFLQAACDGDAVPALQEKEVRRVKQLCMSFVEGHLTSPLKAPGIVSVL